MGTLLNHRWLPKNPEHDFEKVHWRTTGNIAVKPKSRPRKTGEERLPEEWEKDAAKVQVVQRSPNPIKRETGGVESLKTHIQTSTLRASRALSMHSSKCTIPKSKAYRSPLINKKRILLRSKGRWTLRSWIVVQGQWAIFLCLWLWGAQFVVHVSVEVQLALGVFEGEERNGIVRFL